MTKASTLPVMFCLGLLFLPASGLDVNPGSCAFVNFFGDGGFVVCACAVHERVLLITSCCFDCLIPSFFLHQPCTSLVRCCCYFALSMQRCSVCSFVSKSIFQGSRDGQVL